MPRVENCDFCKIAKAELPARIVWQSDTVLAFLPVNPAARGHTLVIPRAHVVDFLALPDRMVADFGKSVLHVSRALQRALQPEGLNLITSAGGAATQTVFHLHVHLVPRWTGDRIGPLWPPAIAADEKDEDAVAEAIRRATDLSR
jgi:histidine triad (HIT) family protein